MSGGSHDRICYKIKQELVGRMHDRELDALMADLVELTHSLEWMDSGDISDDVYWNDVAAFKKKWFSSRDTRLIQIITDSTNELKAELLRMIGVQENEEISDR